MQNARIFLVEDNKNDANILKKLLDIREHSVVVEAVNLESALQMISEGQLEKLRVNVAIIDGMFPDCVGGLFHFNGPIVAEAIRKTGLQIKIIACSGDNPKYGDLNFPKTVKGSGPMIDAIDLL